jgi:hypothetical protein
MSANVWALESRGFARSDPGQNWADPTCAITIAAPDWLPDDARRRLINRAQEAHDAQTRAAQAAPLAVAELGSFQSEAHTATFTAPHSSRSLHRLLVRRQLLAPAQLHRLSIGLIGAIADLHERADRAHGRIDSRSVVLVEPLDGLSGSPIRLTNLPPDDEASTDEAKREDLRRVALIILALHTRSLAPLSGTSEAPAASDFADFGSQSGAWARLVQRLLAGRIDARAAHRRIRKLRKPVVTLPRVAAVVATLAIAATVVALMPRRETELENVENIVGLLEDFETQWTADAPDDVGDRLSTAWGGLYSDTEGWDEQAWARVSEQEEAALIERFRRGVRQFSDRIKGEADLWQGTVLADQLNAQLDEFISRLPNEWRSDVPSGDPRPAADDPASPSEHRRLLRNIFAHLLAAQSLREQTQGHFSEVFEGSQGNDPEPVLSTLRGQVRGWVRAQELTQLPYLPAESGTERQNEPFVAVAERLVRALLSDVRLPDAAAYDEPPGPQPRSLARRLFEPWAGQGEPPLKVVREVIDEASGDSAKLDTEAFWKFVVDRWPGEPLRPNDGAANVLEEVRWWAARIRSPYFARGTRDALESLRARVTTLSDALPPDASPDEQAVWAGTIEAVSGALAALDVRSEQFAGAFAPEASSPNDGLEAAEEQIADAWESAREAWASAAKDRLDEAESSAAALGVAFPETVSEAVSNDLRALFESTEHLSGADEFSGRKPHRLLDTLDALNEQLSALLAVVANAEQTEQTEWNADPINAELPGEVRETLLPLLKQSEHALDARRFVVDLVESSGVDEAGGNDVRAHAKTLDRVLEWDAGDTSYPLRLMIERVADLPTQEGARNDLDARVALLSRALEKFDDDAAWVAAIRRLAYRTLSAAEAKAPASEEGVAFASAEWHGRQQGLEREVALAERVKFASAGLARRTVVYATEQTRTPRTLDDLLNPMRRSVFPVAASEVVGDVSPDNPWGWRFRAAEVVGRTAEVTHMVREARLDNDRDSLSHEQLIAAGTTGKEDAARLAREAKELLEAKGLLDEQAGGDSETDFWSDRLDSVVTVLDAVENAEVDPEAAKRELQNTRLKVVAKQQAAEINPGEGREDDVPAGATWRLDEAHFDAQGTEIRTVRFRTDEDPPSYMSFFKVMHLPEPFFISCDEVSLRQVRAMLWAFDASEVDDVLPLLDEVWESGVRGQRRNDPNDRNETKPEEIIGFTIDGSLQLTADDTWCWSVHDNPRQFAAWFFGGVQGDWDAAKPSLDLPAHSIGFEAALAAARKIGCNLPTQKQWFAAQVQASAEGPAPNLPCLEWFELAQDMAYQNDRLPTQAKRVNDSSTVGPRLTLTRGLLGQEVALTSQAGFDDLVPYFDLDTDAIRPAQWFVPPDGYLLFRPIAGDVDTPRGFEGNVSEFVLMDKADTPGIAGDSFGTRLSWLVGAGDPVISMSLLRNRLRDFGVRQAFINATVGGLEDRVDHQGFVDVGFRLVFPAGKAADFIFESLPNAFARTFGVEIR